MTGAHILPSLLGWVSHWPNDDHIVFFTSSVFYNYWLKLAMAFATFHPIPMDRRKAQQKKHVGFCTPWGKPMVCGSQWWKHCHLGGNPPDHFPTTTDLWQNRLPSSPCPQRLLPWWRRRAGRTFVKALGSWGWCTTWRIITLNRNPFVTIVIAHIYGISMDKPWNGGLAI